jgi:dihydrofolate reductase
MPSSLARPRFSVFIAASLDGYIARSDGRIDWLADFEAAGEDHGYRDFFAAIDTVVVGRNTYETVLGFSEWPYQGKRCIVLAHRPPPPRFDETFFAGAPAALSDQLARDGARRVYVDGGEVIGQFLVARLIDDLTVSVIPIVLGGGRRLFAGGAPERRLVLEACRAWPSGLSQLRYRFAGAASDVATSARWSGSPG